MNNKRLNSESLNASQEHQRLAYIAAPVALLTGASLIKRRFNTATVNGVSRYGMQQIGSNPAL